MRSHDPEYAAFHAGLKPAVRITVSSPADVAGVQQRYGAVGGVSAVREFLRPRPQHILYVARTKEASEALAEAERPLFEDWDRRHDPVRHRAAILAVGRGLGYPECCVRAFSARLRSDLWHPARGPLRWRLKHHPSQASEDYLAAREQWTRVADARLNHLLFRARSSLLSYTPCRYDCPRAIAQADALLGELERLEAGLARAILDELSCTVVVAPDHGRVIVTADEQGRIREVRVPVIPGRPEAAEDVALAKWCEGGRILWRGRVDGGSAKKPWPVALRFEAG